MHVAQKKKKKQITDYIYMYIFAYWVLLLEAISTEISFQTVYSIHRIYQVQSKKQMPAPVAVHAQSPVRKGKA